MKIVVWGLHRASNAGDSVIAECLSYGLRCKLPDLVIELVDICTGADDDCPTSTGRALLQAARQGMPLKIRDKLSLWQVQRRLVRARQGWADAVHDADIVVVGGGHIFSDVGFILGSNVAQLADVVRKAGVPVAVHGVGVSMNWSRQGSELFGKLRSADLRAVTVRDVASREAWRAQFGSDGPTPGIARDPGLLAERCYGPASGPGERIGICVTSPQHLYGHAARRATGMAVAGEAFFANLARELTAMGQKTALFCNGAVEDMASVARIAEVPEIDHLVQKGEILLCGAPEQARDLANMIGGFKAVVAHRLQACVVAEAYGVPCVGLGWDSRLQGFFLSVGRAPFFVGATDAGPHEVAELTLAAVDAGIDIARRDAAVDEAMTEIAAIVDLVQPAPRAPLVS